MFNGQVKGTLVEFGLYGFFEMYCDVYFVPHFNPDRIERVSRYVEKITYFDQGQYEYTKRQYASWLLEESSKNKRSQWF